MIRKSVSTFAMMILRAAMIPLCAVLPTVLSAAVLSGTVRDAGSGTTITGAAVAITKLNRGAITDDRGAYRIDGIPVGKFMVKISSVGHADSLVEITVTDDRQVVRLDVALKESAVLQPEVLVRADADPESAAAARMTEKTAPSSVSVLSAEEIARYPDQSTAETMQRVPGVSVSRVRGEARETIVRGMEARYNSTLIDGIKAPSPATNSRVVQLDFLPSELLQRVIVTKALTPDMEGDAIGGTVNLVMRTAPENFLLRARIGTGYTTSFLEHDFTSFRTDAIGDDPLEAHGSQYRATASDFPVDHLRYTDARALPNLLGEFTIGGRVMDGHLGMLFALDAQQLYQRSEVVRFARTIDADNGTLIRNREYRFHSHDKSKYGLNARADYIIDEQNRLDLSLVGFWRQNREARIVVDTGLLGLPQVQKSSRSVFQNHTLATTILSGTHRLGDFDVVWKGAYADARQFKPDRAELKLYQRLIAITADSFTVGPPTLNGIIHDWQENTDRDYVGSADITWAGLESMGLTVKAGGIFRTKTRANTQNEYRLETRIDTATGGILPPYRSLDDLDLEVRNTGGTPLYGNNNYTCGEDVAAVYAMGAWVAGDLRVVAGARIEATDGHYETFDINTISRISSRTSYTDILPSLHLRYALTQDQSLRFSVGQTISRPGFYDLVPYNTILADERLAGNPDLKRARATNLDLRYEFYPGGARQFSVGMFYKYVRDPIERAIDLDDGPLPTISAKNFGNALNYGIEIVGGIDFLEQFFFQANYTWTHSSITTDKLFYDRVSGRALLVPETRAMQGQAEHVANLAFAFEEQELGTFAQVSFVYTGRRLHQVSLYRDHNDFLSPYPLLDMSIEQKVGSRFRIFARLNNLLNSVWEIREQASDGGEGQLIEREVYGRMGTIGVTFSY